MAILGIIAALIGAISFALYRMSAAADAVRNLSGAAEDAHGLWRRMLWRRKLANDRLELVKEPREAAAAMLVAVAQADGALSQAESTALLAMFETTFELSAAKAAELLTQARWTTGEARDLDRSLARLDRKLDLEQKKDMIGLLTRIAAVDGAPGPEVKTSLDRYIRALKP